MVIQDAQHATSAAPAHDRSVHRVLVAFDGSEGAWAALDRAIDIAHVNHALLTIAAVVEDPTVWLALGPMSMPYTREVLRRDIERDMRRHLANARDEVPASISVTTQMLHGRAAPQLAALARAGRYDLVVTGPRHVGRLARLVRGSVTRRLLARGHTSVLAVKTD